jgi:hypothetical protein
VELPLVDIVGHGIHTELTELRTKLHPKLHPHPCQTGAG